jgi:two-component system, NtrC family, nitrogen regulation response regulator GlnG
VRLVKYHWPGNLRQLRNAARQLVIASRGLPSLQLDAQLEQELGLGMPAPSVSTSLEPAPRGAPAAPAAPKVKRRKPSELTQEQVVAALRDAGWDLLPAADRLGIPRASIYDVLERFPGIRTAGRLSPEEISRCHRECQGNLDAMARRLEVSRRALARRVKELGLEEK